MKPTPIPATPAKALINGKKCVRVCDLAEAWGTSTSTILATDKPHAVPDKYIHRFNGLVWCELEGLRLRAEATKNRKSSYIARNILALLDELETPETPTSKPTDLGTADLIADARSTAAEALNRANEAVNFACDANTLAKANQRSIGKLGIRLYDVEADVYSKNDSRRDHVEMLKPRVERLEKHMDAAESVVKSAANIAEEASETVDRVKTTAQHAADLAKENADIISGEIERLTKLSDDVNKAKKKVRAVDWTLAVVAMLGVVARVVRLLRRR